MAGKRKRGVGTYASKRRSGGYKKRRGSSKKSLSNKALTTKVKVLSRHVQTQRHAVSFIAPNHAFSIGAATLNVPNPLTGEDINVGKHGPTLLELSKHDEWQVAFAPRDPITGKGTLPAELLQAKTLKVHKITMDYSLWHGNEPSPVDMTIFVVSLKNDIAHKVFEETGGMQPYDLNLGGYFESTTKCIRKGLDYEYTDGKAMMNPRRFNIHYVKRHRTAEVRYPVPTGSLINGGALGVGTGIIAPQPVHRRVLKLRMPMTFRSTTGAAWNTVQSNEVKLTDRLYMLFFNNNSTGDAQSPKFKALSIITATAY